MPKVTVDVDKGTLPFVASTYVYRMNGIDVHNYHGMVTLGATSKEEAYGIVMQYFLDCCPMSDGWRDHIVQVADVSKSPFGPI